MSNDERAPGTEPDYWHIDSLEIHEAAERFVALLDNHGPQALDIAAQHALVEANTVWNGAYRMRCWRKVYELILFAVGREVPK